MPLQTKSYIYSKLVKCQGFDYCCDSKGTIIVAFAVKEQWVKPCRYGDIVSFVIDQPAGLVLEIRVNGVKVN